MTDRTAVFIVIAAYAVLSFGILLAAAWFVFVRKDPKAPGRPVKPPAPPPPPRWDQLGTRGRSEQCPTCPRFGCTCVVIQEHGQPAYRVPVAPEPPDQAVS